MLRMATLLSLIVVASSVVAQTIPAGTPAASPVVVPASAVLQAQLGKHVPMKKGEVLKCHLLYPVYADNQLAIPAGSVMRGSIVGLDSDRSRRIHARLWGDFTPYRVPVVRFYELTLPDGEVKRIVSGDATNGAPVLHLSPPAARKSRSFVAQQIAQAKQQAKETIALVTAPGRKDRLVQFLYRQLPYHPQRVDDGTAWTVTLEQPISVRKETTAVEEGNTTPAAKVNEKPVWRIRAYLQQTISSANEKPGNTFNAVVAEPVFNADHTLAIPEGSMLVGTIIQAKPARFFGRAGKLRFDFRQLKLPGESPEHVMGTLAGADSSKTQQLQIDQEGGVQTKPKNRVIIPLVLSVLANRALDDDGSAAGGAAVGSNGFGLVGRVVGIVGGSRGLAAGIGFYAAGLSFSERWLVRGQNVAFTKDTRIEVTTEASRKSLPTP